MIQTGSQCFVKHVLDIVGEMAVVESFKGFRSIMRLAELKAEGGYDEIQRNYQESRANRVQIDARRRRFLSGRRDEI